MFDEDSRISGFLKTIYPISRGIIGGLVIGIAISFVIMLALDPWVFIGILNTLLLGFILIRMSPSNTVPKVSGGTGKHPGRPKGSKNKPKEPKA